MPVSIHHILIKNQVNIQYMAAQAHAGIVSPAANNLLLTVNICLLLIAAPPQKNYISLIKIQKKKNR